MTAIFLNSSIILAESGGSGQIDLQFVMLYIFVIMIAFYLIILRPKRREERERLEMLRGLEKGDEVQTAGGIVGTVYGIDQKTDLVTIEVDKNVRIKFTRGSVFSVKKKGKKGAAKAEDSGKPE